MEFLDTKLHGFAENPVIFDGNTLNSLYLWQRKSRSKEKRRINVPIFFFDKKKNIIFAEIGGGEIPLMQEKRCFLSLIRKSPKFQTREEEGLDALLFRRTYRRPRRPSYRYPMQWGIYSLFWSCRAFGDASYH